MILLEILRMALVSLGVNKLRSFLTMMGITVGVFSVIGVMTAVTALRSSIETGLSFLGTNMFQIAKYPVGVQHDGAEGGAGHAAVAHPHHVLHALSRELLRDGQVARFRHAGG